MRYTVELTRALNRRAELDVHVLGVPEARGFWTDLLGSSERVHLMRARSAAARSALERLGTASSAFDRSWDLVLGTKHLLPRRIHGMSALAVHDMIPIDRRWDFGAAKRLLLPGPYLRSIAQADVLLNMSQATEGRLLSYFPQLADRSWVVPPAVSTGLLSVPDEPVSDLVGRRFVLAVGDPSVRKNRAFLVELWPTLRERHPEAVLAFVGPPGWSGAPTTAWAEGVEPVPGVLELGYVNEGQLRWCYANAAAVACPALLEGYGLPSVEGLAFGTPVITSDDPAMCEASGGSALHLSTLDVASWVSAFDEALSGRLPAPSIGAVSTRTWDDTAADATAAVSEARRRRART